MNIAKYLNQTAVYWANPTPDGLGGWTYDSPVERDVRWTDKAEKFLSGKVVEDGTQELISRSVILAESDFDVNGRLYLGTLLDLDSDELPDSVEALTIMAVGKIPTITATQFLRKVWLV